MLPRRDQVLTGATKLGVAGAAALTLAACGTGASAPDPVPTATVPTTTLASPPAAPTPTPTPACPDPCEPAVDNDAPAAKLTIRLYILTDDHGRLLSNYDPQELRVGWHLTLDAVAKDAQGRETNGSKVLRWSIENEGIVKVGGTHPHQVKITPQAPGEIEVSAKQDGVVSNRLRFVFYP